MKLKVFLLSILIAVACSSVSLAMNPYRKAFVFFAVVRDGGVIAVQSNPIAIADDSESNSYTLTLTGIHTEPGGGGTPVSGFSWENGSSYGGLSSEGRLRAVNVPFGYWNTNSTLYCRFELTETSGPLVTSWDIPIFLRTIEHIDFFFIKNGEGIPQTIPGDLPSSPPDYDYTGFSWSTVYAGGLAGSTLSFALTDSGRTAALQITGNPVSGWAQNNAPFDLYITSESDNPDDECVAEFKGLSWDGFETSYPAAQPTVSLRRLISGGTDLAGYYWIRGQFDGASTISSPLPAGTTARGILQDAPLSGAELTLDENCGLTGLNFSPAYPSSNNVVVHIASDTNAFLGADSNLLPIRFREFDVDYTTQADWYFPYGDYPGLVPEAERTLSVAGGDLFDWSGFSSDFGGASTLSIGSSVWGKQGILLTWPYGGLVDGDSGTINVTLQSCESGYPGWPVSIVSLSVNIRSDFEPPDTSITGGPSGTVAVNDVQFTFTGTDAATPVPDLLYSTWLENYDTNWSGYGNATSKMYNALPNGSYTFHVRAKDLSGNVDPTPATRSFTVDIPALDTDGDGLPDNIENNYCTDYKNPDTDKDGLSDGVEDANHNGKVDAGETNPCAADTDGDGMPDGWEVQYGLKPQVNDAALDADHDGASNLLEYQLQTNPTDPKSKPNQGLPWMQLLLLNK